MCLVFKKALTFFCVGHNGIDFDGLEVELDELPYPQSIIESGAVNKFSTNRGYLFLVVDDYDVCAGVLQTPRESLNSYSIGVE